jgi:hypothetical protein
MWRKIGVVRMNKQDIEKALRFFRGLMEGGRCYDDKCETCDAQETAIDVLEHQLTNGWIPISERLPEEKEGCRDICQMEKVGDDINIYPVDTEHFKASDEVLVTVIDLGDGHVFPSVDNIVNGKWQTYEGDLWKVLAWMPLPEPYREKSLKEENHEY